MLFRSLAVVHANDSKTPLGGLRDRHENIGDGHIGADGFRAICAHPAFAGKAFLLEVPGLPTEGQPRCPAAPGAGGSGASVGSRPRARAHARIKPSLRTPRPWHSVAPGGIG